jgi:hypothetical protein
MYDLIIGKQTMHNLGVIFDFHEKTITIDKILLPMRNIANLKLKPRITRALRENTCFAQEPISTCRCLSFLAVRKRAPELHIFVKKKLGRVPS